MPDAEKVSEKLSGLFSSFQSRSSTGAPGSLQNLSYGYNTLGEMEFRDDLLHDFKVEFQYDALGRMKQSTVTQRAPVPDVITPRNYGYDDLGNLNSKERAVGGITFRPVVMTEGYIANSWGVFMALILGISASTHADLEIPDQIDRNIEDSRSILVLEIIRSELRMQGTNYCGIVHTARVDRDFKAAYKQNEFTFVTGTKFGLPVRSKWVVFLIPKSKDRAKDYFFRSTTCEVNQDEWFIGESDGMRKIFEVDPWISKSLNEREAMVVNASQVAGSDAAFVPDEDIPDTVRQVAMKDPYTRLVYLDYIQKVVEASSGARSPSVDRK